MGFTLRILEGSEKDREYSFDRIQVTIGRTMDNDVVLTDPGISRQHLSIRDKGGAYIVKDLGSSNGTQVNGSKIREEVLRPGDVILAGGAQIQFVGPTGNSVPKRPGRPEGARGGARAQRRAPARGRGRAAQARGRHRTGQAAPAGGDGAGKGGGVKIRSAGMRRRKEKPAEEAGPDLLEEAAESEGRGRKRVSGGTRKKGKRGELQAKKPKGLAGKVALAKAWFMGLDKKKKILIGSAVGLVFILMIAGLFKGGQKIVQSIRWYDEDMLTPGEWVGDSPATYGIGLAHYRCLYRAAFKFKYANGRATMTYMVGGIDTKQEVEILLNGMHVGYADITFEKFSGALSMNLPRRHLLEHEINKVEFINTVNRNNPEAKDEWAVAVDKIEEQPLPPPDRRKAEEAFVNANERYKNKGVSPGNLYKALKFYEETKDYLELMAEDSRPEIYIEASDRIEKIDAELNKIFKDRIFKAEQVHKYGKVEDAKNIFRVLMLMFPNQQDPRHKLAKEAYMNLGGSLQEIDY